MTYVPKYSPFLTPSEEIFLKIKDGVRRDGLIEISNYLLQRMQDSCCLVPQTISQIIFCTLSRSFFQFLNEFCKQ
ncbi:hypothetical protein HZS_1893 [Henneguya salminicola]|nr:hypothetical protein HZS_1893 [Henneguya salminicola]